MTPKQEALFFFRKLVYCVYREIGVLKPQNHVELAAKANRKTTFFSEDRKRQAGELYHLTETEENTALILGPYEERTGLSLADVHRAFAEGHWQRPNGKYYFGGPKWAKITEKALELRQIVDAADWTKVPALLDAVRTLEHNSGLVIKKFHETEVHR